MRSSVDEVRKCNEGGRESNRRAIECSDEDLGVGVEGVGDFEVVGYKTSQGLAAEIRSFCNLPGGSDIGSAIGLVSKLVILELLKNTRAEKKRPLPVRTVM